VTVTLVGSPNESGSTAARTASPNTAPGTTGGGTSPGSRAARVSARAASGRRATARKALAAAPHQGAGLPGNTQRGSVLVWVVFAPSFDSRPGTTLTLRVRKGDPRFRRRGAEP